MICKSCGAPIKSNQQCCEYCGCEIEHPQPENVTINYNYNINNIPTTSKSTSVQYISSKSKLAVLIICLIFGVLGIHRFYVGKIGTGIIYLLTGGICGIGWIVDVLLIATGNFQDRFGLTLRE